MASVISGNQVRLNSGQTVQAQQGGWYDGQQFWGGSLSNPGQINSQSNQQGAGQQVSREVIAQTNPANVAYIDQRRQEAGLSPSPAQTPGGSGAGYLGDGSGVDAAGAFKQPEINLPQLYEQLYAGSGIRDIETELNAKTMAYNEQVSKIKDNPYLSEATMTGRISKLDEKFRADSQAIQNKIAMKKADVETQLNLQTKQFDINSQQAQRAWDQFNNLLAAGALDNANGEDIAQITRATGISSSMVQSAIAVNRKKNQPPVSISQFDDGTNVYAVAIDEQGNIVNRQLIGQSEPTAAEVKASLGGGGGGGLSKTEIKAQEAEQNRANLTQSVKNKITLKSLINAFSGAISIDEIYRIYNTYSPFGKAKETLAEVKQGKFRT